MKNISLINAYGWPGQCFRRPAGFEIGSQERDSRFEKTMKIDGTVTFGISCCFIIHIVHKPPILRNM